MNINGMVAITSAQELCEVIESTTITAAAQESPASVHATEIANQDLLTKTSSAVPSADHQTQSQAALTATTSYETALEAEKKQSIPIEDEKIKTQLVSEPQIKKTIHRYNLQVDRLSHYQL